MAIRRRRVSTANAAAKPSTVPTAARLDRMNTLIPRLASTIRNPRANIAITTAPRSIRAIPTRGESKPDGIKDGGHWIEGLHKGGLRQSLHIPDGRPIPEKRIRKAEHSSNPRERKQAIAAETLKGSRK
jgi:hypothetical protein